MNSFHLNNLEKVCNWIERNVNDTQFNVRVFRGDSLGNPVSQYAFDKHSCGTVGCILGWTPFALKMKQINKGSSSWVNLARFAFGVSLSEFNHLFLPRFKQKVVEAWVDSKKGRLTLVRSFIKEKREELKLRGVL